MKNILLFFLHLIILQLNAQSKFIFDTKPYQYPTDSLVAQNLENWRDQKFGIIIHWGLYAVPGIVESWSICNEDWIDRDSTISYESYKYWYWGLNKKFNPTKFNPENWANVAKQAGMKYLVFTTKHHDGFNMFDTKFSDFKITNGPFEKNEKANVAKYVFAAFRKQNFLIGTYYSKPDWHSQYFWWNKYATPNRNVNYDIRKNPWRWNEFVNFTHHQLNELTTEYGKIDLLWLDGGWVRPRNTITEEVLSWGAPIPDFDQDINMPKLAKMVRKNQEGILIVDRTVHGEFENYTTPEQGIPKQKIDNPWESCITLGNSWGYVPNDNFKTSEKIIHTLIEIVAKGGNLLLGLGPSAEGVFLPEQIKPLTEVGNWLQNFGVGIYNTRAIDNFKFESVFFTKAREKYAYAIPIFTKQNPLQKELKWQGNNPKKGSKIFIVGNKTPLNWVQIGNETNISLDKQHLEFYKKFPAIVIQFEKE